MKYHIFQITLGVLGVLFPSPGFSTPPKAPPVDERLDRIEYRLDKIESKLGITSKADSSCVCGPDCNCPNCPSNSKTSTNGRTVQRVGDRIACMQDGQVVLYLAGSNLENRASEWVAKPYQSVQPTYGYQYQPAYQYTQPNYSSGHYETRCSGGFCRRVWVPD